VGGGERVSEKRLRFRPLLLIFLFSIVLWNDVFDGDSRRALLLRGEDEL
jgi:hypothetical protein